MNADESQQDRDSTSPREDVRRELEQTKKFVGELSMDDLRQGTWFPKLLTFSLHKYETQVNAEYFRRKYPNLPPDAVAQERIKMAARYASIAGGLNATAYTGAIVATIGSHGGASPLTLPAAAASFTVDLVYTSQLQLRLAYDLSVLYGVPLDLDDPDDLWKLIRVAFVVKTGEVGTDVLVKGVPVVLRPLVKKVFSGATLATLKGLPGVGKYLLQRNIIKMAIPGVGVPLAAGVNFWTTKVAGKYAKNSFRREARIMEEAGRITSRTRLHPELLWVLWLVVHSDTASSTGQVSLLHHVTLRVNDSAEVQEALEQMRAVIEVDPDHVWAMLAAADGDLEPLYAASLTAAVVDGKVRDKQLQVLELVADRCGVYHSTEAVQEAALRWQ
ncbi:hypothetical protein NF556_00095 [Ornithinimicrobium faecis]|uniref:Uncharacterized protein n=1 Tax=Ornithinimicrobium faecis TaxID=2934158 RepID=A0ABY4YU51_9MICO|nr:hypothetical protein [Ornithinimicrobium sp. HY1793]USQ80102.1 hypothetical protein NF556_00095 [Ornithinimicrobium sp. HY1793]